MNLLNMLKFLGDAPVADWIVKSFPIMRLIIVCAIALVAIFIIVAVLIQDGSSNGIQGVTGEADTFYNRNKGMSLQGVVRKITVIASIAIVVLCIVYLVLYKIYQGF